MKKFFNKLLFTVIYYVIFRVVYTLFLPILNYNGYLSALIAILSVCASCRALRLADIKKANYYQEVRDEYNQSLKNKFDFIMKQKDIKFEIIFALLVAIYVPINYAIKIFMAYLTPSVPYLITLGVVIFIGIVIIDIVLWFISYNKSFRKKEY